MPPLTDIMERLAPIAKTFGADRMIVFGSYARGTVDRRSDLDLIIIDDEDLPYLRRLDKYFTPISAALSMPVDLFVYRREEFERMRQGAFLRRALSEGIVIYES